MNDITDTEAAGYLLRKLELMLPLFQEARDALPAITEHARRLRGISPTLADRMDRVGTFSIDDYRAEQERDRAVRESYGGVTQGG